LQASQRPHRFTVVIEVDGRVIRHGGVFALALSLGDDSVAVALHAVADAEVFVNFASNKAFSLSAGGHFGGGVDFGQAFEGGLSPRVFDVVAGVSYFNFFSLLPARFCHLLSNNTDTFLL
jgi:hypothetical protein